MGDKVSVEEVDEVAGGAGGMGVDGICEVGDRASEGQVLQRGLWQGNEPGVGRGGWGTRLDSLIVNETVLSS